MPRDTESPLSIVIVNSTPREPQRNVIEHSCTQSSCGLTILPFSSGRKAPSAATTDWAASRLRGGAERGIVGGTREASEEDET
jgi:hypothetical protein